MIGFAYRSAGSAGDGLHVRQRNLFRGHGFEIGQLLYGESEQPNWFVVVVRSRLRRHVSVFIMKSNFDVRRLRYLKYSPRIFVSQARIVPR